MIFSHRANVKQFFTMSKMIVQCWPVCYIRRLTVIRMSHAVAAIGSLAQMGK